MAMLGLFLVVVHDESIAKWFVRRIISIGTKSFHNLSHYGIELMKNDIRLNYQLFGLYKRDVIINYHFNNCEKKKKIYIYIYIRGGKI